jgi:hypothetical protein
MEEPLHLRFGEVGVDIVCEDATLRDQIHRHFRHCQGNGALTPVVTYHIPPAAEGRWDLYRGPHPLLRHALCHRILERLMGDAVIHLTAYTRQVPVFHAAGVARAGRGLLLCGDSGSGKSTLAAWLLAQGFDYLGDEVIAVKDASGEMIGLPRPVILKGGSKFIWELFLPEAARLELEVLPHDNVWLDADWFHPGAAKSEAELTGLVFPRFASGANFQAERLSAAEATFHLLQRLINAKNLPDRGFSSATGMGRTTPAYSLVYADLGDEAAGWFNGLVAG